jgi:hypothetical protein
MAPLDFQFNHFLTLRENAFSEFFLKKPLREELWLFTTI